VVAWGGMRGAVSMAAALALPLEMSDGTPFPGRDLIIFLAYAVIVFTIVVQGLTLPALIRVLGLQDTDAGSEQEEELLARLAIGEAALERLEELTGEDWTREDTLDRMRGLYEYRVRRFVAQRDGDGSVEIEERALAYQQLMRELLGAQHRALVQLRKEGTINDEIMRRVQRELDLEEQRLEITPD
jgi:monovalent cation/hydrogen antiporter